jgi:hypothetical protein
MRQQRRQTLGDTLVVWGILLSLAVLFGLGCFEASKIFAVIPAAFESTPMQWSSPMRATYGDDQQYQPDRSRMTSQQRAQYDSGAAAPGR